MKKDILKACVVQIPLKCVASYTTIAQLYHEQTGENTSGWLVGRFLSGMKGSDSADFPRRRVIGKDGGIKAVKLGQKGAIQIQLLQSEGIIVNHNCVVDMKIYERRP